MRIIGGKLRGIKIHAPGNLPVRPTTDLSKEALFNILNHTFDFEGLKILDLFSGTGNISLEFASRGASDVKSVDLSYHCIQFLKETAAKLKLDTIHTHKADVFRYLQQQDGTEVFDIIFADAPFDHPKLTLLPSLIFSRNLLKDDDSVLIMEHPSSIKFAHIEQFREQRSYGYSSFSFFQKKPIATL